MSSTPTNEQLIDAFFSQVCITRRTRQLNNIPPPRLDNFLSNPYLVQNGGFTMQQLDMRRKAEILTHNSNRGSKVNNLTKSQKYSILTKSGLSKIPVNKSGCFTNENGDLILTPSTACDIPGNVIQLFNDKTVPLYNFSAGNTTKSITTEQDNNYFFT